MFFFCHFSLSLFILSINVWILCCLIFDYGVKYRKNCVCIYRLLVRCKQKINNLKPLCTISSTDTTTAHSCITRYRIDRIEFIIVMVFRTFFFCWCWCFIVFDFLLLLLLSFRWSESVPMVSTCWNIATNLPAYLDSMANRGDTHIVAWYNTKIFWNTMANRTQNGA